MVSSWPKNRKAVFYGGFGYGNIGDDAALEAVRSCVRARILPASPLTEARWTERTPEVLLVGGGGVLLNERPLLPSARGLLASRSKVLLSAGVNCDYGDDFAEDVRQGIGSFARECRAVTVRDEVSRRFLAELGVEHIGILPDLAFLIRPCPSRLSFRRRRKVLAVNLAFHRPRLALARRRIMEVLRAALSALQEQDWDIVFVPCQVRPEWNQDDREPAWQLQEALSSLTSVGVVQRSLSPAEFVGFLQENADLMLGMRLHSNVLAAAAGIPMIGLGYNVKHPGFFDMMGMNEYLLDVFFATQADIVDRVSRVWRHIEAMREQVRRRRTHLLEQACSELEKIGRLAFA